MLDIVLRTTAVYLFLLIGLRLAGKREIGQMTLFDLVVILVIANAVQNAMVGSNTSLWGGLLAAGTLLVLNYAVSAMRFRFRWVARWLGERPTLIIEDGKFLDAPMRREHLEEEEVLMAMREHGVERLEQVERAFLEPDGSISVIPKEQSRIRRRRHVRFLKKY